MQKWSRERGGHGKANCMMDSFIHDNGTNTCSDDEGVKWSKVGCAEV